MSLKTYTGARGSKFVCDDTRGFGDAIAAISRKADAPITSCAREVAAEPLLKAIGKMSQAQLFRCAQNCTPDCHGNCNAANRPGTSTHERRNDGVAYRLPAGFLLRYWQRGIDVQRDRVDEFMAEARKHGWTVTRTYPGATPEAQHVNFRKRPKISLWRVRPLHKGSSGPRAKEVIRLLRRTTDPDTRLPYLSPRSKTGGAITGVVQRSIRAFQRDHGQNPDGKVGSHTIRALRVAARRVPIALDQAGLELIRGFEGTRLYAYNDPAGHATCGIGHLIHAGPVTSADRARYGTEQTPRMTIAEAKRLLADDATRFEASVRRKVPQRWRGSQDRFNALVSFAFNLGDGPLDPGRSLGAALRSRSARRVADAILLYDKAGVPLHPLPGLTSRRKAEAALFLRNG